MQYQITSDNIQQISPSMDALAKDKLQKLSGKLQHVNEDLKSFRVVMNTIPDNQFEVKINATIHGKTYFVHEKGYTLEQSMVAAVDLLARMLQKDKMVSTSEEWQEIRDAKRDELSEEELNELI
ncbi:HPF/RaiA family ribosome-associated protein [candidate division WWE3 bacterium]|jgi:ribosome-associated translation inhibitor RaiA|uniref:HPF/RaiA family ribosome-associated protein n=1 Tax=candidate division WWE3 bacterium TaxID=2053526 RepID=A0A3A4ZD27_UNCKA|nr:MAG: HPF/RaiA family ribosome-associated protein [candidate division WWE3 bacterium]